MTIIQPTDQTPRLSCPLDAIDVTGLLRKDVGDLKELVDSFQDNLSQGLPALIHPVVVTYDMKMISGYRRWCAHKKAGLKEIDYVFYAVLDDATRVRIEVDANKQKTFTWQERVLGIDKYHRFYQTSAHLKGEAWGVRETGKLLRIAKSPVARSIFIAEFLHANDAEIWKADSLEDAFRVIVKREEDANAKLLVTQTMPVVKPAVAVARTTKEIEDSDFFAAPSVHGGFTPGIAGPITTDERPGQVTASAGTVVPLSSMLLKESNARSLSVMKAMGASCCDHIITDPPYGVEDHIETINQGEHFADAADVADEHISTETAEMMKEFIPLAFNAIRERGFLIMWCDPTMWWKLTEDCKAVGFSVQRWPLVWNKTSSCMNLCAAYNWTKNVEFAVVARKVNATLVVKQKSCVWTGGNDIEAKMLGHPFSKPFGLWQWLYDATCVRGAEVLDPFVGKGSSMIPAIKSGLRPRGIECSEKHYSGLVFNIQQLYKSLDANCTFQ